MNANSAVVTSVGPLSSTFVQITWILDLFHHNYRYECFAYQKKLMNKYTDYFLSLQDLTQVKEILISAVLPTMTLYRLPHGQYYIWLQWTRYQPALKTGISVGLPPW